MANILVIDFFNLVKRYTFLLEKIDEIDEGEFYSDISEKIINRISKLIDTHKIDMLIICSDSGFNVRANSVLGGEYKANRNRAKSLSQEQKEKDYIYKLKEILQTIPSIFIEVKDVEADNIIYLCVNYLKKKIENSKFYITTSDTDFLQLLDSNVSIIDWNKGLVTTKNWKEIHGFDCEFLKPKDYALFKSIVGDTSDNIKGIRGIGWKKALLLLTFLYKKLNKDLVIENIDNIVEYLKEIKENLVSDKREKTLCERMLSLIEDNKELVRRNFSIISLDMLETPHVAKVMSSLEKALSEKVTFDPKEFLTKLKFVERFSNEDDYDKIYKKNLMLIYNIKNFAKKMERLRGSIQ